MSEEEARLVARRSYENVELTKELHRDVPFLLILDVGLAIEIYSEFSRSGGAYVPFPNPRSHVIPLPRVSAKQFHDVRR